MDLYARVLWVRGGGWLGQRAEVSRCNMRRFYNGVLWGDVGRGMSCFWAVGLKCRLPNFVVRKVFGGVLGWLFWRVVHHFPGLRSG